MLSRGDAKIVPETGRAPNDLGHCCNTPEDNPSKGGIVIEGSSRNWPSRQQRIQRANEEQQSGSRYSSYACLHSLFSSECYQKSISNGRISQFEPNSDEAISI